MFKIGIWEIVLVVLVAIVLLRPKDLPTLLRQIGRYYAQVRDFSKTVSASIRDFENEINVHTRSFKEPFSCDTTIEEDTTVAQPPAASSETDHRKSNDIP